MNAHPAPLPRPFAVSLVFLVAVAPFPFQTFALLAWLAVAVAGALACRVRFDELVLSTPLLFFGLWAGLSLIWSISVPGTVDGLVRTGCVLLAATLVVARRPLRDLLDVFADASKVMLVAAWLVGVLVPSWGRSQEVYQTGALEGPFAHRNLLGYTMVLATMTFVVQALSRRGARRRTLLWIGAGLLTILATRSSTALVALAVLIGVALLLWLPVRLVPGQRRLVAVPLLVAVGGAVAFGLGHESTVTGLVGRDDTFTGRSVIWSVVLRAIVVHPWRGYGWNSLWTAGNPVTEDLWATAGFPFYHAHNAYLDVTAQVGLVGLGAILVAVAVVLIRALSDFLERPSATTAWPILTLVVVLTFSLTEAVLAINLGLFLIAALAASRGNAQRTTTASAGDPRTSSSAPRPSSNEVAHP